MKNGKGSWYNTFNPELPRSPICNIPLCTCLNFSHSYLTTYLSAIYLEMAGLLGGGGNNNNGNNQPGEFQIPSPKGHTQQTA